MKINNRDSLILYEGTGTVQKSLSKNERSLHYIDLISKLNLNFCKLNNKEIKEILKLKDYLDYRLPELGLSSNL